MHTVVLTPRRLRQEDYCKFKVRLVYIVSSKAAKHKENFVKTPKPKQHPYKKPMYEIKKVHSGNVCGLSHCLRVRTLTRSMGQSLGGFPIGCRW